MLALFALGASGLTLNCTDPPLEVEYAIKYYSGKVMCGNLLLESDIGGTHPWIPPRVTLPSADPKASYALMYIDPGDFPEISWTVHIICTESLHSDHTFPIAALLSIRDPVACMPVPSRSGQWFLSPEDS